MTVTNIPFWRVIPDQMRPAQRGADSASDGHFVLPVMRPATVGPQGAAHVMGGVALASAIDALQLTSEMPLLWASAQFLAPTQHAEELQISCQQYGGGRSIGQWFAEIEVNGRLVQRINAALGAREPSQQRIFAKMPHVPKPEECAPNPLDMNGFDDNLIGQIERRGAAEDPERGYEAVWTRSKAGFKVDACWLAIISDFFLGSHKQSRGGSSLDATFRFIQGSETDWVLSVTEMAAFDRGSASGHARHFAADGTLLAISSQTGVLPRIPADP